MIQIRLFPGSEVAAHIDEVAALRLAVFSDWPYLYAGDPARERRYLTRYARSDDSLFVLAFDDERLAGASTAIPLRDASPRCQQPFIQRQLPVDSVFLLGESVLLPDYRGLGLGHRFFDERERQARRCGRFSMIAFCAVERSADDPRFPGGYHSNDSFWSRRGYRRQDDLAWELEWLEIDGGRAPANHRLQFWLRALESS